MVLTFSSKPLLPHCFLFNTSSVECVSFVITVFIENITSDDKKKSSKFASNIFDALFVNLVVYLTNFCGRFFFSPPSADQNRRSVGAAVSSVLK